MSDKPTNQKGNVMLRNLLLTLLFSPIIAATPAQASDDGTRAVTYCEVAHYGGTSYLFLELGDGGEFTIEGPFRMRTLYVEGERRRIESPVVKHRPRIMDCRIEQVNGKRSMLLTTFGGAEWLIVRPVVG